MLALAPNPAHLADAEATTVASQPAALRLDVRRSMTRHLAATEAALATIREDALLSDWEKGQRISAVLAEANARTLALHGAGRRASAQGAYPQ